MSEIILKKIPNQTFRFSRNGSRYEVTLESRNKMTYLSYSVDRAPKLQNRICLNQAPIDGVFMFEDSKGNENPYYDAFGDRFKLKLLI